MMHGNNSQGAGPGVSIVEDTTAHVDHLLDEDVDHKNVALTQNAAKAISQEQQMTLLQGCKTYPKAMAWSALISAAIVMEGFDKSLITGLFANTAFKTQFGHALPDGSYDLTASWQTALSTASYAGEVIGLAANGVIADRFGCRITIMVSLILVTAFIFVPFFAKTATQLLVGQILMGFPWGVFQTITVVYASEVCPVVLRPYLTTYVNLCWVFGQLIGAGALRGVAERVDQWSYRIPFALQWIWPVPILVGVYLAPESPWWLVRHGHRERARKALLRLASAKEEAFDADAVIAMMEHTNIMEKVATAGTRYTDCFRGVNLRRTEIVCCVWLVQVVTGFGLALYSSYFFLQAGLPPKHAFTLTLVGSALGVVGTGCSWALMARFGRRTLYLWGTGALLVLLLVVGIVSVAVPNSTRNSAAGWATGGLLLAWTAVYDAGVGPVCYALVSELSSTRLRAKSIVLARCVYNVGAVVVSIIAPRMLNPQAWNWGGRAAFFWAGTSLVAMTWIFFRLPEPKGRTYSELEILFERRTPARQFSQVVIEPLESDETLVADRKVLGVELVEVVS
jgi:MFS transporter, SP family, general alpha glucoside:H+ symporter